MEGTKVESGPVRSREADGEERSAHRHRPGVRKGQCYFPLVSLPVVMQLNSSVGLPRESAQVRTKEHPRSIGSAIWQGAFKCESCR